MSTLPVDPGRTINEMIDRATELHNLMLLDTDSRPSADPGPQVMEFAQWAYRPGGDGDRSSRVPAGWCGARGRRAG
jgi:hypothetical protein